MLFAGIAAAVAASALFNVGVVLQALDAREAPKSEGLRLSLLARLLRRKRWVVGFLMGIAGWGVQILAFAWAPFVVVQPVLAAGLLLLLFLGARMLHERVGKSELAGVAAITIGIGLLAWGSPEQIEAMRDDVSAVSVMGALAVVSLIPFALRGRRWDSAMFVIVASSLGYSAVNIATKLLSDSLGAGTWIMAGIWLAVVISTGIAALLSEMTALQRRPATLVVPLAFAIQTFLPVMLEPIYLVERWGTAAFDGVPLVAGLLLVLAGGIAVARTRAVSVLTAGMAEGAPAA
jgi:drug/metabolite transporter (DMT)-like permease